MEQDGLSTTNHMAGPVNAPTVQAGAIHGGVHFHAAAPERAAAIAPPPEDWTNLPELPAAVRFLLRAQIQAAQELPYRLPGARRPSLATVYVRQDLGTGTSDEPTFERPTPILDGRGQLTDPPSMPVVRLAVRPPSRTVRKALDSDNHVLVTGGPGQGKSTLSLRLAADVATKWMSTGGMAPLTEPVVPLRLPARELASHLGLTFPEAVEQSVHAEYGAPVKASAFAERMAGCRWLLLVDGLDEVADSVEREKLVTILAMWASPADSLYRVILTTRPIEGAALAPLQRVGAARYELQPFDEEALRHFADNWFEDTDHGFRFVRQIRAAHLDELVRVPLLATIAAIIFEQHGDRPLPDNQYELYESYLKYLRSQHSTAPGPFDQACTPLLEHLGRIRLEADTSLVAAAHDWVDRHLSGLAGDWHEDLTTYLTSVGPVVRRGDDLRFLHHSFAEHLAATAKARLLPERFDPEHADFARLLHSARPKERGRHARAVLLHYTRLHASEADRLVEWLHARGSEEHLLAARLLAWHVPAAEGVVEVFLTKVRAWAMTTQYPGHLILEQSSRAAHHPGIGEWLTDLMRDENAPWASRVEAATALSARLRGAQSSDAIAHLRMVVADAAIPVASRLAAAEALCDCGGEREASERGLRSIIADPSATALNCRNAALVLASFGGPAREHAVEALTALLDDPWTTDNDRVEAATGLVEIGVEFHDRCAEVFRAILDQRTKSFAGVGDAALGLASLGAGHLAEAVQALTRLATDRRLDHSDRIYAATTLAKLGPLHRVAVGGLLLAMSAEFNKTPMELQRIAESLVQVGLHDEALALLHGVLSDRKADSNAKLRTAQTLVSLGPEHQEIAARVFKSLLVSPLASGSVHVAAFARLAVLGGQYRASAIASLRALLADRSETSTLRCYVADRLTGMGPEFHSEVAEHLLEIIACQANPQTRVEAWRTLRHIGAGFRDQATAALLALGGPDEAEFWESYGAYWAPNRLDIDDHDSRAVALTGLLHDSTRSNDSRVSAAGSLCHGGEQSRRTALDGVVGLLRSGVVPDRELAWVAAILASVGSVPRAELAEAMREVGRHSCTTAETVSNLAKALQGLDYWADPEITTALRGVVADDLVGSDVRGEAAVALARSAPDEMAGIVGVVLNPDGRSIYSWDYQVRELAALGADIVPGLRELLSNVDLRRDVRCSTAVLLAELRSVVCDEALAQLRSLAGDEFLGFQARSESLRSLADLNPALRDETLAYHQAVLNDECNPIHDRCEASYQVVQFDESFADKAFAVLRRFVTDSRMRAEERASAVFWFAKLGGRHEHEVNHLGLAVANDPSATAAVRKRICNQLTGKALLETRRSLLADSTVSVSSRMAGLNAWEHPRLVAGVEAILRDIVTAPEDSPAERVAAAAALADVSPKLVPEAVRLLEELSTVGGAAAHARDKLASLTPLWRRRIVAEEELVVVDETCSWRRRYEAATRIWDLTSNPSEVVVEYLRQLADDSRIAANVRVAIRYRLRGFDGLDCLRAIQNDEKTQPEIRWAAASWLLEYDIVDRAAGARVLHAIASDNSLRPTLRWRVARDLMRFGERGRELAVPLLQVMTADEELSVLVRVDAARALINARPDLRNELLRLLRRLRTAENPLVRIQVFDAIGVVESEEGALGLFAIASDRTLTAGARLRAANVMFKLRRDFQERTAVVAREVAHDERAPIHIRDWAARELAWRSELCRAEARALIVELNAQWSRSGKPDCQ